MQLEQFPTPFALPMLRVRGCERILAPLILTFEQRAALLLRPRLWRFVVNRQIATTVWRTR
jgi:hypothetical protein